MVLRRGAVVPGDVFQTQERRSKRKGSKTSVTEIPSSPTAANSLVDESNDLPCNKCKKKI